jgi:hypothetical protein
MAYVGKEILRSFLYNNVGWKCQEKLSEDTGSVRCWSLEFNLRRISQQPGKLKLEL